MPEFWADTVPQPHNTEHSKRALALRPERGVISIETPIRKHRTARTTPRHKLKFHHFSLFRSHCHRNLQRAGLSEALSDKRLVPASNHSQRATHSFRYTRHQV